jgi:hypothetical protein
MRDWLELLIPCPRYLRKGKLARGIVLYFTILGGWRAFVKYKISPDFLNYLPIRAKIFVDKPPCCRLKGGLCEKKYEPWPDQV